MGVLVTGTVTVVALASCHGGGPSRLPLAVRLLPARPQPEADLPPTQKRAPATSSSDSTSRASTGRGQCLSQATVALSFKLNLKGAAGAWAEGAVLPVLPVAWYHDSGPPDPDAAGRG